MARRNIILTTLSIRRTRYPSGANFMLLSRPMKWRHNNYVMRMNYDVIRWPWPCTWLSCCDVKRVMTSKIFKIKYFNGLNFVLVMNDFDTDNSSKMTFVWPLYDHNGAFSYKISIRHIQFDRKWNRKCERCLTKSWDLIHKLVSLNQSKVYCTLRILLSWTKTYKLHCARH